ncbi:MAG: hypothetical protein H0X29_10695 [Parachlamydiaceae bacterium]|nr:hypothetical protein [Parachlamydiaceae bacterium]
MQDICFWSVGDGDYAYILQTLVNSFHAVGMKSDFHVFSDREIYGAITHKVAEFDKRRCFFKFNFMQSQLKHWDYRHFIYLDADTVFLKAPTISLIELLKSDPLHLFFESDCTMPQVKRKEWWGCPLPEYVRLMHECGVINPHIYNVNGGFCIVQKHAMDIVCELAIDFVKYAARQHYNFPDEPGWAYALHMLCKIPEQHLLSCHRDVWCSDWEGVFKEHLPDGKPWVFRDYISNSSFTINPAIVHAIRSKDLLVKQSTVN